MMNEGNHIAVTRNVAQDHQETRDIRDLISLFWRGLKMSVIVVHLMGNFIATKCL